MCETKICVACKEEKEVSEFFKDSSKKSGYQGRCKVCIKNNIISKPAIKEYILTGELIICKACKIEKDRCYFHYDKKRKLYHGKCNICTNNKVPIVKEKIKEKTCKKCLITKPKEDFYGRNGSCKICTLASRLEYGRNYYKNNSEKVKSTKRKRRAEDPLVSLKENMIASIVRSLRMKNGKKSQRTEKILGCIIEDFKIHIESQFLNWMSWDNRGNVCGKILEYNCSWDLDHIIPISYAKTEEEILKLNHWSNFQPLCSKINRDVKRNNVPILTNLELNITTL